jgi:hypothetical protein
MHIQVITGPVAHEKTAQLQQTLEDLMRKGIAARIIQASAYSDQGLLVIMDVVASGGQRTLLVDDCTRAQIEAVLMWQSETDEDSSFEDLVIHLVRQA